MLLPPTPPDKYGGAVDLTLNTTGKLYRRDNDKRSLPCSFSAGVENVGTMNGDCPPYGDECRIGVRGTNIVLTLNTNRFRVDQAGTFAPH
jgi:hypothetical protein